MLRCRAPSSEMPSPVTQPARGEDRKTPTSATSRIAHWKYVRRICRNRRVSVPPAKIAFCYDCSKHADTACKAAVSITGLPIMEVHGRAVTYPCLRMLRYWVYGAINAASSADESIG